MAKYDGITEELRGNMLRAIETCANERGWTPVTVSRKCMSAGDYYNRLRNGHGFTMATYEKVMRFCAEHGAEG